MYNYAFVAVDSFSRFSVCIPLKSLTAKSVRDALLELWQFTGSGSHVPSCTGFVEPRKSSNAIFGQSSSVDTSMRAEVMCLALLALMFRADFCLLCFVY